MCGIVGYTGKQSVAKQILDALELLDLHVPGIYEEGKDGHRV